MLTKVLAICFIATALVSAVDKYCDTEFSMVSAGRFHSLGVLSDGTTLVAWGTNTYGEVGTEDRGRYPPQVVDTGKKWAQIVAGASTSYALETSGTLWAFGLNDAGQLGINSTENQYEPVRVGKEGEWKMIAAGYHNVVALKKDNTLWGWSSGTFGYLTLKPTQIGSEKKWKSVAAGNAVTYGIKMDGTLWGWGDNEKGQLGEGERFDNQDPREMIQIGAFTTWESISAGWEFTAAIATNGSLYAWGSGPIGNGEKSGSDVPVLIGKGSWSSVSVGANSALAVHQNGKLFAWGDNTAGQIGDGTSSISDVLTPKAIGSLDWKAVSSGTFYSLGITSDGILYSWGNNEKGEIGLGGKDIQSVFKPSVCGHGTCEDDQCNYSSGSKFNRILRGIKLVRQLI